MQAIDQQEQWNIEDCYGCNACAAICPKKAIELTPNWKGFLYPSVDHSRCVECGLCVNVCQIRKEKQHVSISPSSVYAFKNGEIIRQKVSSGGIFMAICSEILEDGGVIIGAEFDKDFNVVHAIESTKTGIEKFRGSKYVQSTVREPVYKEILTRVKNNQTVLFSGTPCQVMAIRRYMEGNKIDCQRIIFVDIVCHGVPSPCIWRDYVNYIEKIYGSKMIEYTFRNKNRGWRGYHPRATFESVKEADENKNVNVFVDLFRNDLILRDNCYKCQYCSTERCGDITIGDYWGIENVDEEFNDNKGISFVMVNTEKGKTLFKRVLNSPGIECREYGIETATQKNLHRPTNPGFKYKQVWKAYKKGGFDLVINKYTEIGKMYKLYYYEKAIHLRLERLKK